MKSILLIVLLFASCSNRMDDSESKIIIRKINDIRDYDIHEVKIDYCEYIIVYRSNSVVIIHKANCTNDYHKLAK